MPALWCAHIKNEWPILNGCVMYIFLYNVAHIQNSLSLPLFYTHNNNNRSVYNAHDHNRHMNMFVWLHWDEHNLLIFYPFFTYTHSLSAYHLCEPSKECVNP